MSKKGSEQPKQNLSKLVSQVKLLSKTVKELEKEVEDLRSKICRNKDKKPSTSPDQPKKVASIPSKKESFRLKFFRKTDKTKENRTPSDSSKKSKTKNKGDSTRRPSSEKNLADDFYKAEKPKRKNECTQTKNQSTGTIRRKTQKPEQGNYSKFDDDCCCHCEENECNILQNSMKDRDKIKLERKMCCVDCTDYLPQQLQSHCINVENASRKRCKNKKLMVNLIDCNKGFKDQMQGNRNFLLNCKYLQNADFARLCTAPKDEKRRRRIKLFDKVESCSSKKDCKYCSKNCKTKNVLKIKKAILTQEPPMIFMSPELEKGTICYAKKKSKNKCKKPNKTVEICCDNFCEKFCENYCDDSDSI